MNKILITDEHDDEYYFIPTVLFYKKAGPGYVSKRLYCTCGKMLMGEHYVLYKFGSGRQDFINYWCDWCGFEASGDDGVALKKAFLEGII